MRTLRINKKRTIATVFLTITAWYNSIGQTLSDVNSQLQAQKKETIDLIDTITWYLLIIAFVVMLGNMVLQVTDNKKAIIFFAICLFIKGIFSLIFK